MMKIAAVTMVYNEPVWAQVWARHYAGEIGAAHCIIIDHGTDDGSLDHLPAGVGVERVERAPLDEAWRAAYVSARVGRLLQTYDAVIHTDADELLVADPEVFPTLRALIEATQVPVLTAIGLDVQHRPGEEPALDLERPIAAQRRWVRFAASMCKPAVVRRAVTWSPGFHSADAPLVFDSAFLLHMRYADLGLALKRLDRTRNQSFASLEHDAHQRVSDEAFTGMVMTIGSLPTVSGPLGPLMAPWLARLTASRVPREHDLYKVDLGLAGTELWDGVGLLRQIRT